MKIKEHLNLLGLKVEDRVTGCKGVITSISFDLYGCVTALVNRGLDKDQKLQDSTWFDIARLEPTHRHPVMERPNWDFGEAAEGRKGPALKPIPERH